jgi:LCP family protein required for cell wall assembly
VIAVPDGAKLRRTWPQRLLLAVNVVVVLACFAAAGGLAYVDSKVGRLQRISLGASLSEITKQSGNDAVQNILMVGVDSDQGLDPSDPRMQGRTQTLNSDTIMILRIDPSQTKAALLSLPRDLWIPLGGNGEKNKINAALPIGGPDLLIRTITQNFGIKISHYVQVDFQQFQKLVDVVGGVPMAFNMPVRDEWTGLDVSQPGCVTLDGAKALDYVRSRHLEFFQDGTWQYDGAADLSRISRQQDFIRKAIKRASDKGLRNPITLNRLVDASLAAITVDDQFKTSDIASLAGRFRSFNPDTFQTYALPVVTDWAGDLSIVRLVDKDAKPVLDVFRGVSPEAAAVSAVRVTVLNGSGRVNEGRSTGDALKNAGFTVDLVADAPTTGQPQVSIRYRAEDAAAAQLLARYLTGTPRLEQVKTLDYPGVELTTGLDFQGIRPQPLPPTTTTTAPPSSGSGATTPPPSTTSTTRVGIVPVDDTSKACK